MSIADWIIAEFRALGWYCVAHGPEFWLATAVICWVIAVGIAAVFVIWRDKK